MLKSAVATILVLALPALAAPSTTRPTTRPSTRPATRPVNPSTTPKPTGGKATIEKKGATEQPKYKKAAPEEHAKAIADAKTRAGETSEKLQVKFTEMQTEHFIIFTDWDPREYSFLKSNCENAYTAVSRMFEMSPKDNIFVGKLPIYMFNKRADFYEFAKKIDDFQPPQGLAGYCHSNDEGFSHMAMSKPDASLTDDDIREAEKMWSYVLTHEFTHAFVARYRSNQRMPRWLNEGVAEVVAQSAHPRPDARRYARIMADSYNISSIFDDRNMPGGEMYPVMMTMTEALIKVDPKKFLGYFNALKDGAEPEKTMKEMYGVDYAGLETAWRKYIKTAK